MQSYNLNKPEYTTVSVHWVDYIVRQVEQLEHRVYVTEQSLHQKDSLLQTTQKEKLELESNVQSLNFLLKEMRTKNSSVHDLVKELTTKLDAQSDELREARLQISTMTSQQRTLLSNASKHEKMVTEAKKSANESKEKLERLLAKERERHTATKKELAEADALILLMKTNQAKKEAETIAKIKTPIEQEKELTPFLALDIIPKTRIVTEPPISPLETMPLLMSISTNIANLTSFSMNANPTAQQVRDLIEPLQRMLDEFRTNVQHAFAEKGAIANMKFSILMAYDNVLELLMEEKLSHVFDLRIPEDTPDDELWQVRLTNIQTIIKGLLRETGGKKDYAEAMACIAALKNDNDKLSTEVGRLTAALNNQKTLAATKDTDEFNKLKEDNDKMSMEIGKLLKAIEEKNKLINEHEDHQEEYEAMKTKHDELALEVVNLIATIGEQNKYINDRLCRVTTRSQKKKMRME